MIEPVTLHCISTSCHARRASFYLALHHGVDPRRLRHLFLSQLAIASVHGPTTPVAQLIRHVVAPQPLALLPLIAQEQSGPPSRIWPFGWPQPTYEFLSATVEQAPVPASIGAFVDVFI